MMLTEFVGSAIWIPQAYSGILFSETRTFLKKIFDIGVKLIGLSTKYQEAVIDKCSLN